MKNPYRELWVASNRHLEEAENLGKFLVAVLLLTAACGGLIGLLIATFVWFPAWIGAPILLAAAVVGYRWVTK